jgi:tRNA(fMet)-specific endonuclease VapC
MDTNLLRDALLPGSLIARYHRQYPADISLSIVSVREALKGALSSITDAESSQPRGKSSLSSRYTLLNEILIGMQMFPIHLYSEQADALYKTWPQSIRRIGPNDCRIAASAAVDGLIVLTRNTSDFERIAQYEPRVPFAAEPINADN